MLVPAASRVLKTRQAQKPHHVEIRVPVDQLINLLQKIPFSGTTGYIKLGKTHTYYFNIIDLIYNYSIQLISSDYNHAKASLDKNGIAILLHLTKQENESTIDL